MEQVEPSAEGSEVHDVAEVFGAPKRRRRKRAGIHRRGASDNSTNQTLLCNGRSPWASEMPRLRNASQAIPSVQAFRVPDRSRWERPR
eukprot:525822-Pyramimonas_sp.AAC.1